MSPYIKPDDEATPGWWVNGGDAAIKCKTMAEVEDITKELGRWGWKWSSLLKAGTIDPALVAIFKRFIRDQGAMCIRLDNQWGAPVSPPVKLLAMTNSYTARNHRGLLVIAFDDAVEGIENQKRLLEPAIWAEFGGSYGVECYTLEGLQDVAEALRPWGWFLPEDCKPRPKQFPVTVVLTEDRAMRQLACWQHVEPDLEVFSVSEALAQIQQRHAATIAAAASSMAVEEPAGCQHSNAYECPAIGPLDKPYWYCPDCKEEIPKP